MESFRINILALAAILLSTISCARYETEDNISAQKRIRDAWMRVNLGKELEANENGLYVIDQKVGSGREIGDSSYCLIEYTARDFEGNYTSYTSAEIAKILGQYKDTLYYSPQITHLGHFEMYTPVEKYIKSLREGGYAHFILPPEQSVYNYPKEWKSYYASYGKDGDTPSLSENCIYEVNVVKVFDDVREYEIEQLEDYAAKNFNGVDSISRGFYMVKLKEMPAEDSITDNKSVKVKYIGKLLDGFCFDTNIQDTAKVYGRYKANKKYTDLSVTYHPNGYTLGTDGEKTYSNEVIQGFAMAVGRMRYGEKAIAFFCSDLAYGSKSSKVYPAYSPMCFYLEVVKE